MINSHISQVGPDPGCHLYMSSMLQNISRLEKGDTTAACRNICQPQSTHTRGSHLPRVDILLDYLSFINPTKDVTCGNAEKFLFPIFSLPEQRDPCGTTGCVAPNLLCYCGWRRFHSIMNSAVHTIKYLGEPLQSIHPARGSTHTECT